ncbi:MAG: hypothetical protein WBP81_39390 [Solirubrobacteraceae bacterium]
MQDIPEEHAHFDALCAHIEAWEPLPTVAIDPAAPANAPADVVWTLALDDHILAVLIRPY